MDIAVWILVGLVALLFPVLAFLWLSFLGWTFFTWVLFHKNSGVQISCVGEVTEIVNPIQTEETPQDPDEPWKNRFPEEE